MTALTLPTRGSLELSIVMPCLNEALTLGNCIEKAQAYLREHGVAGEVIVADNGSTDGSIAIAEKLGARVVPVAARGYGAALAEGIHEARGEFVIMGDCDDSYDFSALHPYVEKLREGCELVMGNRFLGGIKPGAMPLAHRYFGNPILSALGRKFYGTKVCGDFYCGLRGFRKDLIRRLQLQSTGMEYALEMIIKATLHSVKLTEVPTTLSPDGRDRAPHLRTYRDGWRSLRLYLLLSPRWIFGVPGLVLLAGGTLVTTALLPKPLTIGSVTLDYHTLVYSTAAMIVGYQGILLAVFAKIIAVETGLHPAGTRFETLVRRGTLERLIALGVVVVLFGALLGVIATGAWSGTGFGDLHPARSPIRLVISSALLLILGGQTIQAGFIFGLLNLLAERRSLPRKRSGD